MTQDASWVREVSRQGRKGTEAPKDGLPAPFTPPAATVRRRTSCRLHSLSLAALEQGACRISFRNQRRIALAAWAETMHVADGHR